MRILLIQQAFQRLRHALESHGYLVEIADFNANAGDKARFAALIVLYLELAGRQGLALVREWRSASVGTHEMILGSCESQLLARLPCP